MKTNGATWKAYLNSWPFGQWYDDADETVDGAEFDDEHTKIPDSAVIELTCGVVFSAPSDREGKSLTSHFRAWMKAQTHEQLVVSVPKDRLEEFKAYLKTIGASA
jgi:hypothetical protein